MTDSKRIVFTTWGSFGDIHPFMALALEMQAADLLVSHAIPMSSSIVAEVTGVKWISVVLSPVSLPSVYDPPTPPEFPIVEKTAAAESVVCESVPGAVEANDGIVDHTRARIAP
jgi:hypothetical protein